MYIKVANRIIKSSREIREIRIELTVGEHLCFEYDSKRGSIFYRFYYENLISSYWKETVLVVGQELLY